MFDWDYNFFVGWKFKDVEVVVNCVFDWIFGIFKLFVDGVFYCCEGFDVFFSGLRKLGYKEVVVN